jgi:hypothetical protein
MPQFSVGHGWCNTCGAGYPGPVILVEMSTICGPCLVEMVESLGYTVEEETDEVDQDATTSDEVDPYVREEETNDERY